MFPQEVEWRRRVHRPSTQIRPCPCTINFLVYNYFLLNFPLYSCNYQAASQYYVRRCGLLLPTEQTGLSVCLSMTLVSRAKTAALIEMPLGLRTRVGPRNHVLDGGSDPPWEGAILRGKGAPHLKYRDTLLSPVQKQLNRSTLRLGCGVGWAQESCVVSRGSMLK